MKRTLMILCIIIAVLFVIIIILSQKQEQKINLESDESFSEIETDLVEENVETWQDKYADVLEEKQSDSTEPQSFFVKDINNNGVPELIICAHGTCLQIYSFDTGELIDIGEHEFYTGTIRYLISEDEQYPGIFCYFVGGGFEHYCYLEYNDNLEIKELWNKDFTGVSKSLGKKRKKIENISEDKLLIKESKKVVKKNNDISFLKISENNIKELRCKQVPVSDNFDERCVSEVKKLAEGQTVAKAFFEDFAMDGNREGFVLTEKKITEMESKFSLWFVSNDEVKILKKDVVAVNNSTLELIKNHDSVHVLFREVQFTLNNKFAATIYGVYNGKAKILFSKNNIRVDIDDNKIYGTEKQYCFYDFSTKIDMVGTTVAYEFYWDEQEGKYMEYGAEEISKSEFLKYSGGKEIWKKLKKRDGGKKVKTKYTILKRTNNTIDINMETISKEGRYKSYITLKTKDKRILTTKIKYYDGNKKLCKYPEIAKSEESSKVYDAFKECSDYTWLSKIQFSPCAAIEKKIKEIDNENSIIQISNFKFEQCNLCGKSEDLIMSVDVETKRGAVTLFMVFLSGKDSAEYSAATYNNELISYKLIDIDNDSQEEMLVDYTVVSNGTWRYIDILQFSNDSDVIYLFEKSVDLLQHELSYYFSSDVPKKFILRDVKVNGKKKMETEKKIYCYRNKKYVLE
ncbi:MAG: hypothetical protein NC293_00055 [Roseburia sp.]|nr:hypothetical protein [Roseburia sp.]